MKQHYTLLLALLLGGIFGTAANLFQIEQAAWISEYLFAPIGQIFLRSIFMTVVPLVFAALVLGIAELSAGKNLGKIARKTLGYTFIASSISVLVGITVVNIIKPGAQINQTTLTPNIDQEGFKNIQFNAAASKSLKQIIVELIPKNPLQSASNALDGEMIAWMIFAIFFGSALVYYKRSSITSQLVESHIEKLLSEVLAICMIIINFIIKAAPVAVFCLIFNSAYKLGPSIFSSLLLFVFTVIIGLLIQQFVVYSAMLKFIAKRSPLDFFRQCQEVLIYAFSTSSSNATLPKSLETAEKKLNLNPGISRFVLTAGATANQNGTALFEGVTVLFLAQVYQVDLSMVQQIQVVIMCIIAGIGTAGVPGGSLPMILIILQSVGIPAEGIGLILGVDRFLDMARTTLNVSGDLVIATLVNTEHKSLKS